MRYYRHLHKGPITIYTHTEVPLSSLSVFLCAQVCKHIWLGLYDDKSSVIPDFREPQKVKEFLQEKYEKKRW